LKGGQPYVEAGNPIGHNCDAAGHQSRFARKGSPRPITLKLKPGGSEGKEGPTLRSISMILLLGRHRMKNPSARKK